VLFVSRYPFIMRGLPGASVIRVIHGPAADQVTATLVDVPDSFTSGSAVPARPVALFQFACGMMPALSTAPIGVVLLPTKLIPMAPVPDETTRLTALAAGIPVPAAGF